MIRLSGRLQSEHIAELKKHINEAQSPRAFDLQSVTLVDVKVVRFLDACEKNGVALLNCSPYIREWMVRENARLGTRNERTPE